MMSLWTKWTHPVRRNNKRLMFCFINGKGQCNGVCVYECGSVCVCVWEPVCVCVGACV